MRFWHKLPLRGRILSLIFLGMVLILGVFSYFGISAINETTRRVLAERLNLTRQMAANLDVFLTQSIERVTASSRAVSGSLGEANPPPDRILLRRVYDASLLPAHYVSLLDREGNVLMTEPPLTTAENGNRRALPHVQSALSTMKPGLSNITYDAAVQREVAYLAVPLGPAGQPATGLVEIAIDLSKPDLARFLQPADMGATGRAEIVDGTGRVLATSQAESFLKVSDHGGVLASLIKERRTTVSTCHRCHESSSGMTRERDIITFAPLSPQAPWGIVLRQREEEALAPTRQLQSQWVLLGLLSLLATVVLGWVTTENVIRPVKDLTAASRRIASGDLSGPVTASGEDEIGQLARDFETMRARLKESLDQMLQRARELESLNSIAGIINQSMELDTILRSVLEQVMKLVNGEMGGVLIQDEDSQTLSYRVHQGFSDRFVQGTAEIKVGEGIAGRVAQTGEPMLVDDISRDSRLTRPVVSEEGLRAFLSVPIRSRDRTIGVLNITSREPRRFSSQDIRLLSAIGSQVGVAIERARLYDELRQKEQMRGALLRQIISAQEDERKRIARDLHDETSQALTALTMNLESVVRRPPEAEELKASLQKIQGMTTRTLEDVHRIIFDLRPSLLDDLGLIPALRWYAQNRLEPLGVAVNIETRGPERRLPGEIEAALYRIAQEAVSNIAQHSGAKRADLCLEFKASSLVLTVEDDGTGFDAGKVVRSDDRKRGLGLMGMKERAELLGGMLDIRSRNGHGTRVTLAVPITWGD